LNLEMYDWRADAPVFLDSTRRDAPYRCPGRHHRSTERGRRNEGRAVSSKASIVQGNEGLPSMYGFRAAYMEKLMGVGMPS
jgi:hypothetical protein